MNRTMQLIRIVTGCLLLLCSGCTDEGRLEPTLSPTEGREGTPIRIEAVYPQEPFGARAVDNSCKKTFAKGDVIQLSAVFTLLDTESVGAELAEPKKVYSSLKYDGTDWVPMGSDMQWPWNASEGKFTAYYIPHLDGYMQVGETKAQLLDSLANDTDPLMAEIEVDYGYAVKLEFKHLCSKLNLTELVHGDANEYWLKKEGLKNAFRLSLTDDQTLKFEFLTTEATEGTATKLARKADADGDVSFFLAPGDYQGMKLTYRYGRPYLTLNIDQLNKLEANTAYTVDITQNLGEIVPDEDEDEWWEEQEKETPVQLEPLQIEAFLAAIEKHQEYSCEIDGENTPILALNNAGNGTELLVNLDFNHQPFTPGDVPNTADFDGTYHTILNLSGPLFHKVAGDVKNLGLKEVKITSTEQNVGALAQEMTYGTLSGLRLREVEINVTPPAGEAGSGIVCNVGALVGSHRSGIVKEVKLGGTITLNVQSNDTMADVMVGGVVGQSGGELADISLLDDETPAQITINHACKGTGNRHTGGLAGKAYGSRVENCALSATVNASQTEGVFVYTGGLLGELQGVPNITDAVLTGSLVVGSVQGAQCQAYSAAGETTNGHSYTGGLVGYMKLAELLECRSRVEAVTMSVPEQSEPINAFYNVGGAVGYISEGSKVENNTVWSRVQASAQQEYSFVGAFVGVTVLEVEGLKQTNTVDNTGVTDFAGREL